MHRCRAGSVTRAIACGSLYLFPIAVSLCLDPRRMYRAIQALGGYRGYYFCVVYPPRRTRRRRGNVAALPHACLVFMIAFHCVGVVSLPPATTPRSTLAGGMSRPTR